MAEDNFDIREAKVVFTTKELFGRIDERLERIEYAMNNAPTIADLEGVHERIAVLETWRIEETTKDKQTSTIVGRSDRVLAAALAITVVVINVLAVTHVI